MKRETCLAIGCGLSVTPIILLCIYAPLLNTTLLTSNECILTGKSYRDYNCSGFTSQPKLGGTYSCGPTESYELIYMAKIKDHNEIKQLREDKGQECLCRLAFDLYTSINIEPLSGVYPIVAVNLEIYNSMIVGQEFKCYIDDKGEIYKSFNYITKNTVISIVFISSFILCMIVFLTIYLMFYDWNCTRRKRYTQISINDQIEIK